MNYKKIDRIRICLRKATLVSTLCLFAPAAFAQTTSPETNLNETEIQLRQLEEQRRAGAAARQKLPATENVTFADVLKDPDNVDLNFKFAKAQVNRGDVKGAIGTLERILLVTPDLASIRLFYAILLFRLDSLDESEREFLSLSKLKLAPKVRLQIEQFLSDIVLRRKKTRYKVQLTVGGHYDSNRNSAPRTNQVEVGGILFDLVGRSRRQDDFGILGVVTGELVQDLGMQAPHELHVSATYFYDDQFSIDSQDTSVASLSVGPKLRFSNLTITPKLNYANLRLSREKLFEGYGAEVLLEAPNVLPWKAPTGFFKAKYTSEEFYPIRENTIADNLDGHRYEFEAGLKWTLDPRNFLTVKMGWNRKVAFGDTDDRYGYNAGLSHIWLMDEGQFLVTSADFNINRRRTADLVTDPIAPQVRHDRGARFRMTYGAPVGFLLPESKVSGLARKYYDFYKDITWTISAEIFEQRSNIINFDFVNVKAQTLLSKVWKF